VASPVVLQRLVGSEESPGARRKNGGKTPQVRAADQQGFGTIRRVDLPLGLVCTVVNNPVFSRHSASRGQHELGRPVQGYGPSVV